MAQSSLRYCGLISYRMKFSGLHFSVQFSRLPLQSRSVATSNTVITCCGTYWLKLQSHFCLPIGPCDGRWLTTLPPREPVLLFPFTKEATGTPFPISKISKNRGNSVVLATSYYVGKRVKIGRLIIN